MIILQRVPHSLKFPEQPTRSCYAISEPLRPGLRLLSPVSPQPPWPPCSSMNMPGTSPPQSLCTACSLFLECSSPRYPQGPSPNSFNSLLRRATPDHPFNFYFQILSTRLSLYRFMYIFPQHLPSMLPLHNILCK